MITHRPEDRVAIAALNIRAAANREWIEFLEALKLRAVSLKDNCVNSPGDVVLVNQGKAREAVALLELLTEAPALVERLKTQRS